MQTRALPEVPVTANHPSKGGRVTPAGGPKTLRRSLSAVAATVLAAATVASSGTGVAASRIGSDDGAARFVAAAPAPQAVQVAELQAPAQTEVAAALTASGVEVTAAPDVPGGPLVMLPGDTPLTAMLRTVVERFGNSTDGYANGLIPADVLCPLPFAPGHRLRCDAAAQLVALNAVYRDQFGRDIPMTDSYRSLESQFSLKATKGFLAATPGYSMHGWGLAVDLGAPISSGRSAEYTWLRLHGPDYGWDNPPWARADGAKPEPWHFEFFAAGPIPNRALSAADVAAFRAAAAGAAGTGRHDSSQGDATGQAHDAPRRPAAQHREEPPAVTAPPVVEQPPAVEPVETTPPAPAPKPEPTPARTPTPVPTPTGSPSPTPPPAGPVDPAPEPTPTPTEPAAPAPTPTTTPSPEPSPTGTPTAAPGPDPTVSPSPEPTQTALPDDPAPEPTGEPAPDPAPEPAPDPVPEPDPAPADDSTAEPAPSEPAPEEPAPETPSDDELAVKPEPPAVTTAEPSEPADPEA